MNKKELIDLGIDEDLAQQIIVLHGKDIESLKAASEQADAEVKRLTTQLQEAGSTIESFKSMDVDGLQAAVDEWKTKATQAETKAAEDLKALKFDHAIKDALQAAKVRDPRTVKPLLDFGTISLEEDGTIKGLEEQLEAISSEKDYLFDLDEPAPRVVAGTQNKSIVGDEVATAARKGAGL